MISCPCCELSKQNYYCSKCLNEGLRAHEIIRRGLSGQSEEAGRRAAASLEVARGVAAWRKLRAEVRQLEKRVDGLKAQVVVPSGPPPVVRRKVVTPCPSKTHPGYRREQLEITTRIVHARQVLVREAVSVFGVRHDSIAGLPLPRPDDFQREYTVELHTDAEYPTSHTNAAIVHVIHLLSLIQQYLSVEVPFVATAHRSHRPHIIANTPYTSTSKFRTTHVLQIRSRPTAQTLTAYALFCHSISYLAWSQGVNGIGIRGDVIESDESETEDPESQILIPATAVLELLETMSQQPTLGIRSHAPGTTRLKDLGFGLDVKRVVQALLSLTIDEEGWHLVEHATDSKMHARPGT